MTDSRSVGKHRGHDDSTLTPLFIITLLSLEHSSDNNEGLSSFTRSPLTLNDGRVLTPCKANIVSSDAQRGNKPLPRVVFTPVVEL